MDVKINIKLIIVFFLSFSEFDKLIFYAFLLTCVSVVTLLAYKIFCNKKFETAHFKKVSDKNLLKELISFSSWSLFGATANMCNTQGINMVLNIFTNVVVNAAYGISNQVNTAIFSFVSNFQTAFNPSIVKTYAAKDNEHFQSLIFESSKISFFLFYLIFLPLFLNVDFVLSLWLKKVPEYSVKFVRLILIWSLIDIFNNPLYTAIQASGKINVYNIVISIFKFIPLPIIILLFHFGFSPEWIFYIEIAVAIVADAWRLFHARKIVGIKISIFIKTVIFRCVLISLISFFASCFLVVKLCDVEKLLVSVPFSILLNTVLIYFVGLNSSERKKCKSVVQKYFKGDEQYGG